MPDETEQGDFFAKAMDTTIRLGLALLLVIWSYQIVSPFIGPIIWGIIIAIGCYPAYRHLEARLKGRAGMAAFLFTFAVLVVLIVPTVMLSGAMVDSTKVLAQDIADGSLSIPAPPEKIAQWPIIGEQVYAFWSLAAENLSEVLDKYKPQLKAFGGWLLGAAAKVSLGLLLFVFSIILAGVFLANSSGCGAVAKTISNRVFGKQGPMLLNLSHVTVLSVARGILGIALAQAILSGLGFLAIGIPGAGVWALICLVMAVVQIDILLILIPLSIYAFSFAGTGAAILFLIWNIGVGLMNNVLKPILLGRGVDAPMAVIFIGAIGGLMVSGIIGLFVGAVILVLAFKLFMVWLEQKDPAQSSSVKPEKVSMS